MINGEMIENPVLEEIDESDGNPGPAGAGKEGRPRAQRRGDRLRKANGWRKIRSTRLILEVTFRTISIPGFKTGSNFEEYDKPSFEHFLSKPSTLSGSPDAWQLGSLSLRDEVARGG